MHERVRVQLKTFCQFKSTSFPLYNIQIEMRLNWNLIWQESP